MIKLSTGNKLLYDELRAQFDEYCSTLLGDRYADRLSSSLVEWTLPSDRRLPKSLLDLTLGELLQTPFDALAATVGIGPSKIRSLFQLLDRIVRDAPLSEQPPSAITGSESNPEAARIETQEDPTNITELTWSARRASIVEHGLGDHPIGCFVRSLSELPRAVWNVPLRFYADLSLAEIRRLRMHGAKRVGCVLQIFAQLEKSLAEQGRFPLPLTELELWIDNALEQRDIPDSSTLRTHLLAPLIRQIHVDLGEQAAELVRGRLGWNGGEQDIRCAARHLRVARSRIYQLQDDVAFALRIRWPRGKEQLRSLLIKCSASPTPAADYRQIVLAFETLFAAEFCTEPAPSAAIS